MNLINLWEHLLLDGYGIYVYTAYAIVFICLIGVWLFSWLRWRNHLKKLRNLCARSDHEQAS